MRILNLILAAAVALGPMLPSPAMAQPRAGGKVDTEREVMTLLSDLVKWAEPVTQVQIDAQNVALYLIDGVIKASAEDTTGAAGRAWAEAWLKEADGKVAEVKGRGAALAPPPMELARRYRSLGPEAARQLAAFEKLPGIVRESAADNERFLASLRVDLVPAAGGSVTAKQSLYRKTLAGTRLSLRSENAMLNLAITAATRPDHPEIPLARSIQASNDALGLALGVMEEAFDPNGGSSDTAATGKAMKAKVAEARVQAKRVWPNAQTTIRQLTADVPAGPLRNMIVRAMNSYEQTAAIELQIADILDTVADNILSPGGPDFLTWNLDPLEPLVNRRVELRLMRMDMLKTI